MPERARLAIADPTNVVVVSAASIWEASFKAAIGRLEVQDPLPAAVLEEGFDLLAVTADHAWAQGGLPLHHRDPFDRLLVAQARAEHLRLVSDDTVFALYEVDLLSLS